MMRDLVRLLFFVTGQSQIEINKRTAPLPGWLSSMLLQRFETAQSGLHQHAGTAV